MRYALLLLALLAACDPVVEQRQIGPAVSRTYETTENYTGYCYSCLPGFDGKMTCGFKLSAYCQRPVTATAMFAPFERTHESGKVDTVWVRQ